APERAAQGQGNAARALPGVGPGGGPAGVRPVPGDVGGEVPQGDGGPGQGAGGTADVLRLPGGAWAALADDQRERGRVRDGGAVDGEDQGVGDADRLPAAGVQAEGVGKQALARADRLVTACGGHQRNCHRGGDQPGGRRLTKSLSTTLDNTPAQLCD